MLTEAKTYDELFRDGQGAAAQIAGAGIGSLVNSTRSTHAKNCFSRCGPAPHLAQQAPRPGCGAGAHVLWLAWDDALGRPVSRHARPVAYAPSHSLHRCPTARPLDRLADRDPR